MKNLLTHKYLFVSAVIIGSVALTWSATKIYGLVSSKPYTIGLVYIPTRIEHEKVNNELIEKIQEDGRFAIKKFYVSGEDLWAPKSEHNETHVQKVCQIAADSTADLFICTGINCAKTMASVAKQKDCAKPIIFIGTSDPVKLGLVNSLEVPGGIATGVIVRDLKCLIHPLEILALSKPSIKKILLPYATLSEPITRDSIARAQEICKEHSIKLTILPIENESDTLPLVANSLAGHDTLIYLEGDLITSFGPGLGKLATQNNMTLLACSPDGLHNAAFTYCVNPMYFAHPVLVMAINILINGHSPAVLPVKSIDLHRELTIDKSLCRKQDLYNIDAENIIKNIQNQKNLANLHHQITIA